MLNSTTKTSQSSITSKGVTLNGTIGWIDYFGPVNEFKYCSGSRSGSYTGDGYYQANRGSDNLCNADFSGTSFYSTSTLSDQTGTAFRLLVRSKTSQDLQDTPYEP